MGNNSLLDYSNIYTTTEILSKRVKTANISVIKEMMYLAELEIKKGKKIISLGVGIPFYKMPQYIREHVLKIIKEKPDIDKYTFMAGLPKLRQVIAKNISLFLKIPTSEDEILITPGCMGALMYTMTTILNKNDEVILFSPYFSSHAEQIKLSEGIPVAIPLLKPKNKDSVYRIDLEQVRKKINKRTKAILVCNPTNPTGAVFLKEDLISLAKIIEEKKIYLITDETYDFLIYDEVEYFNIASIKELWPRVIRCWSFSKKYGMTGWRLGYLHTNKELLNHILKIHDATIVCVSHISQEAGYMALLKENDELERNKKALQYNRDLICKRLDQLSDLFSYVKPQGAYYIFPKYTLNLSSVEFAKKLLYEAGVVVVPGIGFGQEGERHIRMSFGGNSEEINEAFNRIEKWWNNYKKNYKKL